MNNEAGEPNGYIFVQEMADFFEKKRENVALTWISVQCSLLFREEFQDLCTPTKYIYLAIMLTCGLRGTNELPFNIKYLARIAGVNRRLMSKGIDELLCADMLTKRERKRERKEKKEQTDRRADAARAGVSVELKNPVGNESENEEKGERLKTVRAADAPAGNAKLSQFSLNDCLRYVEKCIENGDKIANARALATHLQRTGESDAFITAALYPADAEVIARERFGEPTKFSDEPCRECFGAKMSDKGGKGYAPCEHCRNERGKSTGKEPEGVRDDAND